MKQFTNLAINNVDDLVFGRAPKPVKTRRGLIIGGGAVYPELNFTLPTMEVFDETIKDIKTIYSSIVEEACKRACELSAPGLVIEFETVIEMTLTPSYAVEITKVITDVLESWYQKEGLKNALRLTPNDTREKVRPPKMRSGKLLDDMWYVFEKGAKAGGELLSIETTGGKEIHDDALLACDLEKVIFANGIMGPRDMEFVWGKICEIAGRTDTIAAGDTACGFGNTAMVLAERKYIPKVFAAVVRATTIARSLVAYEMGAVGPGKDCGYENPYLKAITGYPMSMEGKTAACAHLSPLGNIAAISCDLWSNESVQNIKLLGGMAPTIYLEQLVYDCRLMNQSIKDGKEIILRNILSASDAALDPQALILAPVEIIRIAKAVVSESNPYLRTKAAAREALEIISQASADKKVHINPIEESWIPMMQAIVDDLPATEDKFIERVLPKLDKTKFVAEDYNL